MAIEFNVTTDSNWLSSTTFNVLLLEELYTAELNIAATLEKYAKLHHRYNDKSGKLHNATRSDVLRNEIKTYIDDRIAPYGKYVHDGQRSWAPDTFISDAITANSTYIDERINVAIETALDKYIGE